MSIENGPKKEIGLTSHQENGAVIIPIRLKANIKEKEVGRGIKIVKRIPF